jgi:NAD(P)-dependent dehydrogenase (short-subunit alcohol dehydrogenase family)
VWAIDEAVGAFGGLDCLINNAGIAGPTAPVEEVTVEEFEETLRVPLSGAFLCAKHAAPHLRASAQGRIVNVSSVGGKRPYPSRTPYASSKMGMIGLGRALAFELADDDVTVNTICPGPVAGDRIDRVIQAQAEERGISFEQAKQEVMVDELALDEMVQPEDVAEQVAYLVSDAGEHITAQDVNVDSGMTWY